MLGAVSEAGGEASDAEAASCSSLLRRQPFLAEGVRQCLHAPQRLGFGFFPDPGRDLAAAPTPKLKGDFAAAGAKQAEVSSRTIPTHEAATHMVLKRIAVQQGRWYRLQQRNEAAAYKQDTPGQVVRVRACKLLCGQLCRFCCGSDGSRRCWATDSGRPRSCASATPSLSHDRDDQLSSGPDPASCAAALRAAKLAAVTLWYKNCPVTQAPASQRCLACVQQR